MEMYQDTLKNDVSAATSSEDSYFNRDKTLLLIELFKQYKPSMTKGDIKTMKEMWEIIATDLSNKFGISVTGAKCQNRFKVLERGYKKMLNDKEAGKRRKKNFPYAKEFKDIQPRKYEFVPGLVSPYNTTHNKTEKIDSSSTESAAEVNYTETVYLADSSYAQQNTLDINQTEYITTEAETIEAAEITVQTSVQPLVQPKQHDVQWSEDSYFNRERTLALISLFKEYAPQVSIGSIKTKKEMWETIAKHMSEQYSVITSSKCENRFKVLERNFKQLELHNSHNDGRPLKKYEFEAELREVFGNKYKNQPMPQKKKKISVSIPAEPIEVNNPPFTVRVLEAQPIPIEIPAPATIERILLGIRSDLQYYHNERLKVEWRKLAIEEEKLKLSKRKLKLQEEQMKTGC